VSNTAFRGFGGPQGVLPMEDAILRIARVLGRTPEQVRAANFYGEGANDETPYGQKVEDNRIRACIEQVSRESDWSARRAEIDAFNRQGGPLRRGLGMFPLKFGISFNVPSMNQAGALVHVYSDGSIRLNHGGTEMGQGLFVKVAQVVAEVFQVDLDRIRVTATSTGEVPNTSPTAASTGSDLNGWAAFEAASTIKARLTAFAAAHFEVPAESVSFRDNHVHLGPPGANRVVEFGELARLAHLGRVSLSSTGFYRTPKIHWDPVAMKGRPFFYFLLLVRRGGGRGRDRYAHRRESRVARRPGAGLRPVAEPGDRSGPDRGCFRAGYGLADLRGAVVGWRGPAAHQGTVDLQDSRQP
jgi:xanthine dehydrogenase large subunit